MAVVVLCSVTGAPGTTTTALGLALQWPRPVLLAECDRDAPQAISGGYLGGQNDGRGMASLMQTARRQSSIRGALLEHAQRLDVEGRRLFLPGFRHPSASSIFTAWGQLAEEFADVHYRGMDVLVDAGRVGPTGLPSELLRRTDQVLVATRSSLRALVGLSGHLPTLLDQVESVSAACEVGLAVIGPDRPYSATEISAQFGLPTALTIDWSPEHAEVLSDAAAAPRRFATGPYVNSLVKGAHGLHRRLSTRLAHRDSSAPTRSAS